MKKLFKTISIALVLATISILLLACVPKADKIEDKLKDKDYLVLVIDSSLLLPKNVEATVTATNGDEAINITYYTTTDAAKEAYKKLKDNTKDDSDKKIGRRGKAVYVGTKQAKKDAGIL
jgi:competence protein ComGC